MALSDSQGILASPLTIINRKDEIADVETIINLINQHEVGQIVVGLPLAMDGGIGQQAEKIQLFTQKLCNQTEVSVEFRDERLTTVLAKRLMRTVSTKKSREKARYDAVAAALILQGYLDEEHPG